MGKHNCNDTTNSRSENIFSVYCGIVIKKIRKEKGMSGFELAKKLNLSQQQISRYELGLTKLNIDMMIDIADCLGITFEQLIRFTFHEIYKSESDDSLKLKNKSSLFDSFYFY
ncbi:helix-turn-helix transcriptional regulator (plasmid) [Morganella morganii]|uniref:helix-turn-helix domain-containing protein n=1 Tax=Morganella morganii TaxID=582 RepID=UPI000D9779F1|nr:helix-turn-helix transcriptional regulator [Morganella morganii]WNP32657.1 helix-turn-helix transcriptional regulator [Morganella morganii]SPX81866.1 transcriptional regulator, y4mF family [Morganella morganii]